MGEILARGSTEQFVVCTRLSKAQVTVWTTPNFVCVCVVLAVVLPKADFAYKKALPLADGLAATARASQRQIFNGSHKSPTRELNGGVTTCPELVIRWTMPVEAKHRMLAKLMASIPLDSVGGRIACREQTAGRLLEHAGQPSGMACHGGPYPGCGRIKFGVRGGPFFGALLRVCGNERPRGTGADQMKIDPDNPPALMCETVREATASGWIKSDPPSYQPPTRIGIVDREVRAATWLLSLMGHIRAKVGG